MGGTVSMTTMGTRAASGMPFGVVQGFQTSILTLLFPSFSCELVEASLHSLAEAATLLVTRLIIQTCASMITSGKIVS